MTSAVDPVFEFKFADAMARGRIVPAGFLVLAGSTTLKEGTALKKRDRKERDRLVRIGVLVEHSNPQLYIFSRDHICSSASQAAGIVKDGNASGPQLWLDPVTNVTLKEQLQAATL